MFVFPEISANRDNIYVVLTCRSEASLQGSPELVAALTADVEQQTDQWPVKMEIGKMEDSHWCYQIPWPGAPCLHQLLDLRQGMLAVSCEADRSDVAFRDSESRGSRTYTDSKTLSSWAGYQRRPDVRRQSCAVGSSVRDGQAPTTVASPALALGRV